MANGKTRLSTVKRIEMKMLNTCLNQAFALSDGVVRSNKLTR